MSEWKEYKLGEIVVLNYGKALAENKRISGNVPVYSSAEITGWHNEPLVNSKGLIIGRKGTIGKVYYSNTPFFCIDTAYYILPNEKIYDLKFLFYKLKTVGFEDLNEDSAVPGLNRETAYNQKVLLPPLPEQKAIASILSSLDDKIDLLHRQNATLEKMAETLFRQWFVERRPEPDEGEAKEEWEEETFEKWILETVGGDWGKESIEGEFTKAVCCLRGTDIADLNIGLPNKTPIRFIKEKKFQSIYPKEGDLIIEVSGGTENQSTGRICYIDNQVKALFDYPLVFSNFCRMIRIKKPEYSFFVYCYIQYLYNQDEFFNLENGSSGIKNLDYKTLLFDLKYIMPDENSVIKFHNQVKFLFQKVNQNKIQIRTLTSLRDMLLPKLMSGEIRVESHRDETSVKTNNDTAHSAP